jgi:hypothetical protein
MHRAPRALRVRHISTLSKKLHYYIAIEIILYGETYNESINLCKLYNGNKLLNSPFEVVLHRILH